jgi:hypothetical protein
MKMRPDSEQTSAGSCRRKPSLKGSMALPFLALCLSTASALAQNYEHEVNVDNSSPSGTWDGTQQVSSYTDKTLLRVNVPTEFWQERAGGVRIRIFNYYPNAANFELFVYESDALGNKMLCPNCEPRLVTSSRGDWDGSANVAIGQASGYYLIEVVYTNSVGSKYCGEVKFISRDVLPPDQQQPLGLDFSLPSVSSGERPGPEVLYAPRPYAPQLDVINPPFRAKPLLVSGAEAYINGEYLYQDYLYDDYGSDTNGNTGQCLSGAERAGDIKYPTDVDRYGGNAADLVEFRIFVAADKVTYRFTLNTLLQPDSTIAVVAFDTDQAVDPLTGLPTTGSAILPRHPGQTMRGSVVNNARQGFPGTDEVITTWGTGAEHSKWNGTVWVTTLVSVDTDTESNQITVIVPRNVSNPQGIWKTTVAVGLYDPTAAASVGLTPGGWLRPNFGAPDFTNPGGGNTLDPDPSGIFNLAFRFNEEIRNCNSPPDTNQSVAISNNDPTHYAHEINFADLEAGINRTTVKPSGMQIRLFPSRLNLGEGRDLTTYPTYLGQLQPYSIYIPTTYAQGTPMGLTVYLHGSNQFYYQFNFSNLRQQIGELRENLVLQPLGRDGNSHWRDKGEFDIFEAWNDVAAHFRLDPSRAILGGISMGGFGTYRIGLLYPDLFGQAFTFLGPAGLSPWPGGPPIMPPYVTRHGENHDGPPPENLGTKLLTNLWLENARNLPFKNLVLATDQVVPIHGPHAQNLGDPQLAIKGFDQWLYRFYFMVRDFGDHLLTPGDDFHFATTLLGDGFVDRNPTHITFAHVPKADEPPLAQSSLGLTHNHAYWISDLKLADETKPSFVDNTMTPYPAKGVIDVKSHASGFDDPLSIPSDPFPRQCIPGEDPECLAVPGEDAECLAVPATIFERTWSKQAPPLPGGARNHLDAKLTNLASATIDLPRAGLDVCQPITLAINENDSACRLTLAGPFFAASVTGASFEQTPDGVVLLLNSEPATVTIVPSCNPNVVSRKIHGADPLKTFDIDLPLTGDPGIECRTGGANGNHLVIVSFAVPVTVASAMMSSGTGSVSSVTVSGKKVTVNLTGVANAQTIAMTLVGVNDGTNSGNVVIPMKVLAGDTTGNSSVNSSDVSQTKAQSGTAANAANFRTDVTVSGTINSSDVSFVKSKSGTASP